MVELEVEISSVVSVDGATNAGSCLGLLELSLEFHNQYSSALGSFYDPET